MFIPLKDKYLGCWIVWEVHRNYRVDRDHERTKKECLQWISKNGL